jgi:hypothetical protein
LCRAFALLSVCTSTVCALACWRKALVRISTSICACTAPRDVCGRIAMAERHTKVPIRKRLAAEAEQLRFKAAFRKRCRQSLVPEGSALTTMEFIRAEARRKAEKNSQKNQSKRLVASRLWTRTLVTKDGHRIPKRVGRDYLIADAVAKLKNKKTTSENTIAGLKTLAKLNLTATEIKRYNAGVAVLRLSTKATLNLAAKTCAAHLKNEWIDKYVKKTLAGRPDPVVAPASARTRTDPYFSGVDSVESASAEAPADLHGPMNAMTKKVFTRAIESHEEERKGQEGHEEEVMQSKAKKAMKKK